MSVRRNKKLAEKYEAKQAWKANMDGLLKNKKNAEAQFKSANEIIGKVQAKVKDAFDSADAREKLPETLAKIVGVDVPEKKKEE